MTPSAAVGLFCIAATIYLVLVAMGGARLGRARLNVFGDRLSGWIMIAVLGLVIIAAVGGGDFLEQVFDALIAAIET